MATLLSLWGIQQLSHSVNKVDPEVSIIHQDGGSTSTSDTSNDEFLTRRSHYEFRVVLHVDPGKLRNIKPRVHGFFVKRVMDPSKTGISRQPLLPPVEAPWPVEHVCPDREPPIQPFLKRDRHRDLVRYAYETLVYKNSSEKLSEPKRWIATEEMLREIVQPIVAKKSRNTAEQQLIIELASSVPRKSAFDLGTYETQMWYDKYMPKSPSLVICPEEARKIARWLDLKTTELKKKVQKPIFRQKNADSDFIVPDDIDREDLLGAFLILEGPAGSGKSTAVLAAAEAANSFVITMDSSSRRSGKDLTLKLTGISESRLVHASQGQQTVILIEDVDCLFETEATTFWPALMKYCQSSKRPTLLCCEDLSRIPSQIVAACDVIKFKKNRPEHVADVAWLIALCQGHLLHYETVAACVGVSGSLPQTLAQLQFLCQMGIGGRRSGIDWLPKQAEIESNKRVVNVESESWTSANDMGEPTLEATSNTSGSFSTSRFELVSALSLLDRKPYSIVCDRPKPEETFSGHLVLEQFCEPRYIDIPAAKYLNGFWHSSEEPLCNTSSVIQNLRDIRSDTFTQYSTLTLPYLRDFARSDRERATVMSRYGSTRLSRRSWAALGVDCRQYLSNGEYILSSW